jgi:hypothetical protein
MPSLLELSEPQLRQGADKGLPMTILDDVRNWALGQCDWQREAVARLEENLSLDDADYEDLYAILKSARGIPDPRERVPQPKAEGPNQRPVRSTDAVSLLAVSEARNVNALARKGSLTFAQSGLTVIYGSNGSGKSGYARVLKQTCFARDKREKVLPNANLSRDEVEVPSADILASVGEVKVSFTWTSGVPDVTELSRIAVFDHTCGLLPVSQTPSLGVMMKPEVVHVDKKNIQWRVQA